MRKTLFIFALLALLLISVLPVMAQEEEATPEATAEMETGSGEAQTMPEATAEMETESIEVQTTPDVTPEAEAATTGDETTSKKKNDYLSDTIFAYMIGFAILGILVGSLWWRYRNLQADEAALREIEAEIQNKS